MGAETLAAAAADCWRASDEGGLAMHRSETRNLGCCSDCGTETQASTERAYSFGTRGLLCFECAIRRGGRYDETHDHWSNDPRIDDLGAYEQ
jgi:hypothetical protein